MNSKEILEKIKKLSNVEKRRINYDKLKEILEQMTPGIYKNVYGRITA